MMRIKLPWFANDVYLLRIFVKSVCINLFHVYWCQLFGIFPIICHGYLRDKLVIMLDNQMSWHLNNWIICAITRHVLRCKNSTNKEDARGYGHVILLIWVVGLTLTINTISHHTTYFYQTRVTLFVSKV